MSLRLECEDCGFVTVVDGDRYNTIVTKLKAKPVLAEIVDCEGCHMVQYVLRYKVRKGEKNGQSPKASS